MSPKTIEMLMKAQKDREKERSIRCQEQRVCTGGCGNIVDINKMSKWAIKYKKFVCLSCENKRKEKYKKSNRDKV